MGLFSSKKKEPEITLQKGARCTKCRKKIRPDENFIYIDHKLYCAKCGRAKRDWDMLMLFELLDDD